MEVQTDHCHTCTIAQVTQVKTRKGEEQVLRPQSALLFAATMMATYFCSHFTPSLWKIATLGEYIIELEYWSLLLNADEIIA